MKADLVRYIQECLYLPSDEYFTEAIDTGAIKECGIDRRHINIANIILGPTNAAIEGNIVQQIKKMQRNNGLITHIPASILERYGMVTLNIDVMPINKRPFILSVSYHIKYFQCLETREKTVKTFMNTMVNRPYPVG